MPADMDSLFERSQWDGFWLPAWAHVVDRPAIRYTWSARDQHALNQVSRVRMPEDGDLEALVAEVSAAHRGVHSRWLLAPQSQLPGLPPLLQAHGWAFEHVYHLRTLPTDQPLPPARAVEVRAVADAATLVDCIRVCERAFTRAPQDIPPERIADELGGLAGGRVHRFVAYDRQSGAPMASAGLNTFPSLGIGFLWGGGTHPEHRQKGAYRALVNARLDRARALGCAHVGVYAQEDTSDPILAGLGFQRHGTMRSWGRG